MQTDGKLDDEAFIQMLADYMSALAEANSTTIPQAQGIVWLMDELQNAPSTETRH
jgi:hypothetical protein